MDKVKTAPKKTVTKAKKPARVVESAVKVAKISSKGLSIDTFDIAGKVIGKTELSKELFGVKINKALMTQAVRVYLANQRIGTQSTKTRGEVVGSTRKIYRQKGTGRARHGGITAPIFVGGGVALGPKPRSHALDLPQKMRRVALSSALTSKLSSDSVWVVDGYEKLPLKTKGFVTALTKLGIEQKKRKVLLVLPGKLETLQKASRNVEGVHFISANQLNTYEVLNNRAIVILKSALETLEKTFVPKKGEVV
ncbi:MAG: 50S ribosomal protein L4 [Candidatus Levybacteria bacterium]|nr:50S ribosomal protein L4 [Candidatus Levybacteria bacterium]